MNLEKLYQQTILEYSNRKDLKREMDSPTYIERGHNPNCGDDITVQLQIEDGIVKEGAFIGIGCAISTASLNATFPIDFSLLSLSIKSN